MKKLDHTCVDALGIPVDPEGVYGYSRKANGFTTIVVGEVSHSTNKNKISLKIKSRGTCLYDADPWKDGRGKDVISVHSTSLFKLDADYFNEHSYEER